MRYAAAAENTAAWSVNESLLLTAMVGHQIFDRLEGRGLGDALRNLEVGDEPAGGALGAGHINGAFETLTPWRVEHRNGEAGGTEDVDGRGVLDTCLVEPAAQLGYVNDAAVGGAERQRHVVEAWRWLRRGRRRRWRVGRNLDLVAGVIAQIDLVDAPVVMQAKHHAVVRLFENDKLRHALEQRNHQSRRQKFEAQGLELKGLDVGIGGVEFFRHVGLVGAHVHVRPSAYSGGAEEETGDGVGGVFLRVIVFLCIGEGRVSALNHSHDAFAQVDLLIDGGRVALVMGLLAGADFAYGDGSVNEAIGPRAVDVEEADGFVGEQAVVGDEVVEGHADH